MFLTETSSSHGSHLRWQDTISRWLLMLLAFGAPLVMGPVLVRSFELPQAVFARLMVWLALATCLPLLLGEAEFRNWLRANPLLWSLAALTLVIVVTTLTAVDPRQAFWGSFERSMGALTYLSLLALMLLVPTLFATRLQTRRLIWALIAGGLVTGVVALLQAVGWQPFTFETDARSPIYGTIGRSNFLGAYLAMLLPVTLALFVESWKNDESQKLWVSNSRTVSTILLGCLVVSEVAVLVVTLSRAAYLAGVVGVVAFAFLSMWRRAPRLGRIAAFSGLIVLILLGPLAVIMLGQQLGASVAARNLIWQGVVQLIADRPLLGYGLDNLQLVFPAVFDSELVYVQGRVLTVDRAHNWFLDTWVTLGLPGLLSWLSIYAAIGLLVWRRLRDSNKPDPLLAGVIAGIVAGFTNNLVSFDIPPNATATVLLLGIGIALCRQPADVKQVLFPRRKRLWLASSALFLVLALAAAYQWGWKPLKADMAMRRALLEAEAGNGAEAVAAALHAISLNPIELHYKYVLAEIYYLYSQPGLAQESIEQALAAQPENILYWLAAARHYSDRESTLPLAARAYRQAAELGPELAVVYAQWGRFYLAQEDADHAAPLLRRAAALDGSNAVTYFDLSAAERMLGRIDDADAYLEEAQRLQALE